MAVIDLPRVSHAKGQFARLFTGLAGAVAAWNDRRVTRAALERLSEHELNDIGLTRGDIDRLTGLR